MTRKARTAVLYDGCYAHVFSRSIEKRFIFRGEENFERFKKLLLDAKKRYGFRIFHYCLMHTHFHLAAGMEELAKFSAAMKWLKWQYTAGYNKAKKRRGTVWQERFRSLVIEDERYLRACGLYIEHNPVEAGLVKRAAEWPHSSSRCYEKGENDALVDRYEWGGVLPEIEGEARRFFERGSSIGSSLFRLYVGENPLTAMPVP